MPSKKKDQQPDNQTTVEAGMVQTVESRFFGVSKAMPDPSAEKKEPFQSKSRQEKMAIYRSKHLKDPETEGALNGHESPTMSTFTQMPAEAQKKKKKEEDRKKKTRKNIIDAMATAFLETESEFIGFVNGRNVTTQEEADTLIALAGKQGWEIVNVHGSSQQQEMLWLSAMRQGMAVGNFLPEPRSEIAQVWAKEKQEAELKTAPPAPAPAPTFV